MGVLSSTCTTSGAFTPDSVVERHSSGAAQLHSNQRIFSTSLGDPTVPASLTRQLSNNQEFAMVTLELRTTASTQEMPPPSSIDERIVSALANSDRPMPIAELRTLCRIRNATLRERLIALTRAGQLLRDDQGYRLTRTNRTLTANNS
jgi:hypothetical protein